MFNPAPEQFSPPVRELKDLERDDIVRKTLDEVERRLGALGANHTYQQAWKVVVKIMRGMKP